MRDTYERNIRGKRGRHKRGTRRETYEGQEGNVRGAGTRETYEGHIRGTHTRGKRTKDTYEMEMHNYREEDEEGGGCKPYQALVYLSLDILTPSLSRAHMRPLQG